MRTVLALTLLAGAASAQPLEARRAQLSALVSEMWEYQLRTAPEFATSVGDKRYNDRLSDYSLDGVYRDLAEQKKFLARAEAIDPAGFPEQEAITHQIAVRSIREALEGARFKDFEMPLSPLAGIHIGAPQLVSQTTFETPKDFENYLARLRRLPLALDQTIETMRAGMRDGLMPPRVLLEQVARQVRHLASQKAEESPFFAPARKSPRFRKRIARAIRSQVLPAYAKLARFVEEEYAPSGRAEPGLWALPDGEARYAYAVKVYTTSNLTPDQIHELGLAEVKRNRAAMLEIANAQGYADLESFDAAIRANQALHPKSREDMLARYRNFIDAMYAKLPELFGRLPRAKLEVQPIEEYREKEATAAAIEPGSLDGKRPARIQINTSDFAKRTVIDIETTAYHEGVPGHHMQMGIAQELPALPPLRRYAYYGAFVEGWALYAERISSELGAYSDPYSRYGHLQADLLRAIRLVADTGYHAKRWSRQQVVDYFHENSGIDEVNVQTETDRYMAWPAQGLAYKIGQLKFLELRELAKSELGKGYDVRAFHDLSLSGGALPLDVLERRVRDFIAAQKQVALAGSGGSLPRVASPRSSP